MAKIDAVIFDWAGTTMDYGCYAPAVVFRSIFEKYGVPISMEEARLPMGAHKKVHIRKISEIPEVRERWKAKHGKYPDEHDVENMFRDFIPEQMKVLADYADLIPGTLETVSEIRKRGLKIGSTTGYLKDMMALLKKEAAKRGYEPDSSVCAEDVHEGRPAPWMCVRNAEMLGVYPLKNIVKVDDTVPGILEGVNAGMWTIGLAKTGNEMGLNEEEVTKLEKENPVLYKQKLEAAYKRMYDAGADYVVDGIADVVKVIDDINHKN